MRTTFMDTKALALAQFDEQTDNPRLDLALYLFAIESFHNMNTFGFSFYLKNQRFSGKHKYEHLRNLSSLLDLFASTNPLPIIKINNDKKIISGIAVLATALFRGKNQVRVQIDQNPEFRPEKPLRARQLYSRPNLCSDMEAFFLIQKTKNLLARLKAQ